MSATQVSPRVTRTPGTNQDPAASRDILRFIVRSPEPSNPGYRATLFAVIGLLAVWAILLYSTWGAWGSLTVDSGREMYVASVLARGKTLYRDVWYPYGPAGPYLNSLLFRLFGVRLEVLYWAGSLAALGCAVLLYVTGKLVRSPLPGWTAGAIVLVQSFQPGLFGFPLPYSFCAVYGCLAACLFLCLLLRAALEPDRWVWVFAAASVAAAAMLSKLEYGAACYAALVILIAARFLMTSSPRGLRQDLLAVLPGLMATAAVTAWMTSLRGVGFITQQNIASWPTSWFMKAYGTRWLAITGFGVTKVLLADAAIRVAILATVVLGLRTVLRRARARSRLTILVLSAGGFAYLVRARPRVADLLARLIFFPNEMVLFVAAAAVGGWWLLLRRRAGDDSPAIPLLFTFSSLLAFRIALGTMPSGYSIYYDGPSVLSFLLLAGLVVRSGHMRPSPVRCEALLCFACLAAVTLHIGIRASRAKDLVRLQTQRGTIRVSQRMAAAYSAAIAFIKGEASQGRSVLSVPEDTSLYFLSGTVCPTRVFAFTPGVVAPGGMTSELIGQLERTRPDYLLWSNRTFPEYGVPVFGRDFDRALGDYFRSHYHPVRRLLPENGAGWDAVIWERNREGGLR